MDAHQRASSLAQGILGPDEVETVLAESNAGVAKAEEVAEPAAHASPVLVDALWASDAFAAPGEAWRFFSTLACLSHSHADIVRQWRTTLSYVALDGGAISSASLREVARRCSRLEILQLSRSDELNEPLAAAGLRRFYMGDGDTEACATITDDAIVAPGGSQNPGSTVASPSAHRTPVRGHNSQATPPGSPGPATANLPAAHVSHSRAPAPATRPGAPQKRRASAACVFQHSRPL